MDENNELKMYETSEIRYFSNFEQQLKILGLPYKDIIASQEEREKMKMMLPIALGGLSESVKKDATYLSKFVASTAIGLNDAALNYLWNEVIISIRGKIILYGLDLFYDAAIGGDLRDTYETEEDLVNVKDNTLIDACRKIELISDILHEKLKHILYMRNNIGASHPNNEQIRALDLLSWLETCVKDVINDNPSTAAIYIQQLIVNIKNENTELDQTKLEQISDKLKEQNSKISGNLLTALFGIFVKENTSPKVRENILKLSPFVWEVSPEDVKYEIGFKIDHFTVNLDDEKLKLANSFLDKCDGNNYKSESTRMAEINELLDRLSDAHDSYNNFHLEVPIAKKIRGLIKNESEILASIEEKLIKTVLKCRIGNGTWYQDGVSPGAKGIYEELIMLLNSTQVKILIKKLQEPDIRILFTYDNCIDQTKEVLGLINLDLQDGRITEIITSILDNLESAKSKIFTLTELKELMSFI